MPHLNEDTNYLREWAAAIRERAKKTNEIAQSKGSRSYFSIGCTAKTSDHRPYLTPTRMLESGVISGVIVFSQTQAIIAASLVDGVVDFVLVDTEKKLGIQIDADHRILSEFGIDAHKSDKKARSVIELGNISAAAIAYLKKSKPIQYKPNDITVESVWSFISLKLGNLSGRKAAIIGCGNTGFKLALKLVESGVNVDIVRRNASKGMLMANAINVTKPETTLAQASYVESAEKAALFCDVLIGATPGQPVITWEMIQCMSPNGFVIDIGKGTVTSEGVKNALETGIEIYRTDVAPGVYGFISLTEQMQKLVGNQLGRRRLPAGYSFVSGGAMGSEGDVVVDNAFKPTVIYGVCDGRGDLKTILTAEDQLKLSKSSEELHKYDR